MAWRSWRNGALALTVVVATARGASAQVVRGELVEDVSGNAIAGAMVVLLDSADREVDRTLSDALGRYELRAPAAGRFRLRTRIVGLRSHTSDTFDLVFGTPREHRVELPAEPVRLPALVVQADRRCRVRPEAGIAAGELWQEARKALETVVYTESRGLLDHHTVHYVRALEPRTLEVLEQRTRTRSGRYRGSPWVTRSPDSLATGGYIRPTRDGGWIFDAPDARVLLSDAFADRHCFTVERPGRGQERMIGLRFEPVRDRDLADITGVLWLDTATAELRYLEYRYTELPFRVETTHVGGRVEFTRLAQGPWIVERWWIRMPEVGVIAPSTYPVADRQGRQVIRAYREEGGWVDRASTLDGEVVLRARTSALRGTLRRGHDGRRVDGADLVLLGTDRTARTDGGRFFLDSLAAGRYYLIYAHDDLGVGALPIRPRPVVLNGGDTVTVDLEVPEPEDLLVAYCPETDPVAGRGMVGGLVRDAESGAPVPGARVTVAWSRWVLLPAIREERTAVTAEADESGFYVACDVPTDVTLEVRAEAAERVSEPAEARIPAVAGRLDVALPPSPREGT